MFRSIHHENSLAGKSSKNTSRDFRFHVFSRSGEVGDGRRSEGNDTATAKGDISEESGGMGLGGEDAGAGVLEEAQLLLVVYLSEVNSATGGNRRTKEARREGGEAVDGRGTSSFGTPSPRPNIQCP
jgi:hypothetical protein